MDLNKLKVPELRKELQTRGLDSKGNKPVLVERLREAIEREKAGNDSPDNDEVATSEENSTMSSTADDDSGVPIQDESTKERTFSVISSADSAVPELPPVEESNDTNVDLATPESVEPIQSETEDSVTKMDEVKDDDDRKDTLSDDDDSEENQDQEIGKSFVETGADVADHKSDDLNHNEEQSVTNDELLEDDDKSLDGADDQFKDDDKCLDDGASELFNDNDTSSNGADEQDIDASCDDGAAEQNLDNDLSSDVAYEPEFSKFSEQSQQESEVQKSDDESMDVNESEKNVEQASASDYSQSEETAMETADTETKLNDKSTIDTEENIAVQSEETMETQENTAVIEEPRKRVRKSRFDQPGDNAAESNDRSSSYNAYENDRKRKHSPSPSGDHSSWGGYEAPPKVSKQDDEPSFDDDAVLLSWYDSDLNLTISKENFVSAVPLSESTFVYMWAGARSTYGFQSGKVYFDVKLLEKNSINVEELELHSFRVGWSAACTSRQLGEVPLSYGFDLCGKKCVDSNFEEYGQSFNVGDIVGCLVDFKSSDDESVAISFTVNGASQNIAFEIPKEQLEGKALFPHVLSKNISFEVNFGERAEPWELEEKFEGDYEWASKVPLEDRVKGSRKPEEKKDCEVMMMCGLPCSGKTTWITKHLEENVEKMYNVIGIDDIVSKMKILDESIEEHFKDNVSSLVDKCSRLVERLLDLASVRWRNYIIDQPNVAIYIQRRRMRSFEGFTRTAVLVLPKEEDYDKYQEKWDENTLRDNSTSLMEFKSSFRLPEVGDLFEDVKIVGVGNQDEAEELIRKYNREGRDSRPREDRYSYRSRDNDRYGRPPGGGFRSRWMDRGHPQSMSRGGWGGHRGGMERMPPSGFRERPRWRDSRDDDRDYRNRYPPRDQRSRYDGSMMSSRGSSGSRWNNRDRDRMGGPPRSGGPNPLMGSLIGPPRADEHEDTDKGSMGDDDRKRPSRFSDGPGGGGGFRGRGGGYRGRGGDRLSDGGRSMGGSRFGSHFRSSNGGGPRDHEGGGGYRGGRDYVPRGPPGRDGRDTRNAGGPPPRPVGGNRFEKRDPNGAGVGGSNNNKNDSNAAAGANPQQGWGQGNWNQYQNWAQYQQAMYNPQLLQQYWSQMQQSQQNAGSAQAAGQQGSKPGSSGPSNPANSSNTKSAGSSANAGYSTQGYDSQSTNTQGYDANAYAQYCAYYSQLAAQQGWQQNADGTYQYPQGAWSQYGYNYAAAPGGTAGAAGASGGSSSNTGSSGAAGGPSNATVPSK